MLICFLLLFGLMDMKSSNCSSKLSGEGGHSVGIYTETSPEGALSHVSVPHTMEPPYLTLKVFLLGFYSRSVFSLKRLACCGATRHCLVGFVQLRRPQTFSAVRKPLVIFFVVKHKHNLTLPSLESVSFAPISRLHYS